MAPLLDKVFGVLVSASTFHNNRVLLLRRSLEERFKPGSWSIPAGKILPREASLEEAVRRELYEEAGIHGDVRENIGMRWFESTYYEQLVHHIQFDFIVMAHNSNVRLLDKSNMDYLWMPIQQVNRPPVPLDEFTRSVLLKAIRHMRS